MQRALVVICIAAAVASMGAGPAPRRGRVARPATQALIDANALWTRAAGENDRRKQVDAWRAAAQAFDVVADDEAAPPLERVDAAYAAMVSWRHVVTVDVRGGGGAAGGGAAADGAAADSLEPTPFEPDEAGLFRAIERYLAFPRGPIDDEAVAAMFLRANLLRRHNRFADADPAFAAILAEHPEHEVAEYAAELYLDDLDRQGRYDELVALAERLRGDALLVAGRPDLERTLDAVHLQSERKRAALLEREARATGSRDDAAAVGRLYLAIHDEHAGGAVPPGTRLELDELLYDAMVSFESAGEPDAAVAAGARLLARYSASPHAGRTRARIAVIEAARGRYAAALDALEAYVRAERKRAHPARELVDAASDAVYYAVALAAPARAAGIVDAVATTLADRDRLAAEAVIAQGYTRIGKRAAVAARAKAAVAVAVRARATPELTPALAALGGALAAAACPVELVDELCPKRRTKALVAAARQVLARVRPTDEPWVGDAARRVALDLELEAAATASDQAALVPRYEQLLDSRSPEAATAALRLATLARRARRTDEAIQHYRRCIRAEQQLSDARWLDACERGLAALGAPDADLVPERRAHAITEATVEISTEGP